MAVVIQATRLKDDQIINKLRLLRPNSLADSSRYTVAALLEIQLEEDLYAYVSGVNVENNEHNRLGIHAEQNAVATTQTLLGKQANITRVWVMGAPSHVNEASDDAMADIYVQPCGHCRQILLGYAGADVEIYSVTVKGKISAPFKLKNLLPHAFVEENLDIRESERDETTTAYAKAYQLLMEPITLEKNEILQYFKMLTPRIINSAFKTSPIESCLIKLASNHYVPGTLVQDIAFLTTDAIFTALGLAVTQFGHEALEFSEVHLSASSLDTAWLTGSECRLIGRFAKQDIPIHFYTPEGKRTYKLSEMNGILN